MCSISTRLFLKTLPFTWRYSLWYLHNYAIKHNIICTITATVLQHLQMVVNLLRLSVLAQQSSESPHPSHPHNLLRQTSISRSFSLTISYNQSITSSSSALFIIHARPKLPECLPFLLAANARLTRDREWMVVGFLMISPSLTSLRTFCLELALLISVVSLGSSQILRLPHLSTEAASLFCSRKVLHREIKDIMWRQF